MATLDEQGFLTIRGRIKVQWGDKILRETVFRGNFENYVAKFCWSFSVLFVYLFLDNAKFDHVTSQMLQYSREYNTLCSTTKNIFPLKKANEARGIWKNCENEKKHVNFFLNTLNETSFSSLLFP